MEANDDLSLRVASFSCYLNNPDRERIYGSESPEDSLPDPVTHFTRNRSIPDFNFEGVASEYGSEFFSSCLGSPENNDNDNDNNNNDNNNNSFVFRPVEDPTVSFVFPQRVTMMNNERRLIRNKNHEISIFEADKYFNTKFDLAATNEAKNAQRPGKIKTNKKNEIPIDSSAACKTTIDPIKPSKPDIVETKPKKEAIVRRRRSIFGGLGCQWRCMDKKAVVVHQRQSRDDVAIIKHVVVDQDEQRKSVEVFRTHKSMTMKSHNNNNNNNNVEVNLERKLSVLTWDAIPNNNVSNMMIMCDDMASDASSDLFEIENISTNTASATATATAATMHGLLMLDSRSDSCESSTVTHYSSVSVYDDEKKESRRRILSL